jgi:hypothetical protein
VTVSCSVSGQGTFAITASIESPDMKLTIDGTAVAGQTGTASMTFYTLQTLNPLSSSTCTLTLSGASYTVESGHLWAQYNCSNVTDPNNLQNTCGTTGIIVFNGCSK